MIFTMNFRIYIYIKWKIPINFFGINGFGFFNSFCNPLKFLSIYIYDSISIISLIIYSEFGDIKIRDIFFLLYIYISIIFLNIMTRYIFDFFYN